MKLAEALRIVQAAPAGSAEKTSVYLVCGFLPLHLATFLEANLRCLLPGRSVEIQTGLYGDVAGNLERLRNADVNTGVVILEWADFDPRLGLRGLGGWGVNVLSDIVSDVQNSSARFLELITAAAEANPVIVSLPTLPLPPLSYHVNEQASSWQLQLTQLINDFAVKAARLTNVKILNQQQVDKSSPMAERLDVKSDLSSGFPYSTTHASRLAEMLALLVQPRQPKKGLITDLDDTLWRGLVGEEGIEGISWSLSEQSHTHALYQQVLMALSSSGVLIGVASKNDPALALSALERNDLIMPREHLFPIEVNWQAKSQSIGRILQIWNVSADSVVFVDDSPHEVGEVKSAFPTMECLLFPGGDDQAVYDFLGNLRGLFGKESIVPEDAIRQGSVRQGAEFHGDKHKSIGSTESFLQHLDSEITLALADQPADSRALDLINKTNQFNLNGRRLTRSEFQTRLTRPNAFILVASYKDKYGPLGKIAVMLGWRNYQELNVDAWVMSCRAFSRHIEHKCLEYLFEKLEVSKITFDYQPTDRNTPLQEFFASVMGEEPQPAFALDRETFFSNKPTLHHTVKELVHA